MLKKFFGRGAGQPRYAPVSEILRSHDYAYGSLLSFDGKTYPNNPSVPPVRKLEGNAEGKIVIPRTVEGTPP